jgi:hypothetical protein
MTGFELFVVSSLLDIYAQNIWTRYHRDGEKVTDLVSALVNGTAASAILVYWLVVAAWPAIT